MATSGLDLRLERVAARVKLMDLAPVIGRDRRTVARYEGLAVVPEDVVQKYREALATFREVADQVA
jgi:hypothetical protein